jgi:all-trans-8'-apo-beta-carotenal 15,15'-oxygenase
MTNAASAPTTPSTTDHRDVLRAAPEARDVTLTITEGAIPQELRGTLLRNGPGVQRAGETPVHFLDGYGFVASARFEEGRAVYQAREVDLPLARRERAAGKLLARRPFTNRPGGRLANLFRLALSTGASHDVYAWGGAVVASDIDGHYLLDPVTLDTKGPAPLNTRGGGMVQISAMPRPDAFTGNLVAWTTKPGILSMDTVTFYELDAQWQEKARVTRSLGAKGVGLHDHTSTENYYVAAQFGRFDVGVLASGAGVPLDSVRLPDGASGVVLVPRKGDGPVRRIPLGEKLQLFHVANAYEEDGKFVADGAVYEGGLDFRPLNAPEMAYDASSVSAARGPFFTRFTLDLATGAHAVDIRRDARGEAGTVRPDRHGRRHRYAWVSAPGTRGDEPFENAYYWYHAIGKIDCDAGRTVDVWDAGPRVFVSAPQVVARGEAEDDAWVLAWTHDAANKKGELVILDASNLARGPIARLALPAPLPAASHVDWMAG